MDVGYRLGLLLLGFLLTSPVFANVYGVTPVQLFLSSKQMIGVVSVTNESEESGLLQLSLVDWKQNQGKDIYKKSHDILMTPPLFKLPPHKTQVIRFALKHPVFNASQQTYRLHIKELEQPRQKKLGQTLYFLMDISLPLFVQPQHVLEQFVWSTQRLNPKHIKLKLYNDGNVTLFVKEWQLLSKEPQAVMPQKKSTFAYVLPHQSHSWIVAVNSNTKYTDIKSNINGQSKKSVLHRL
ncbi:putative pili assembly chaperone transmembrane protein [Candidatus Rickettsiella viridis]|uniref:Putative pili assembly chaperone transmembrane protein n=1 Tax=Candidatus Rickettsiella viridis TaxID=676208 RepID=A0A2Z5UTE0_9COXI|nr:fimbria/pilus periplasmic chaperone [Candidatus Rickettsiella viridis]BBB14876.1 putative pili assembly chaperone transmembrane protein [Candidatus Rickettsiella viridis]